MPEEVDERHSGLNCTEEDHKHAHQDNQGARITDQGAAEEPTGIGPQPQASPHEKDCEEEEERTLSEAGRGSPFPFGMVSLKDGSTSATILDKPFEPHFSL